MEVQTLQDLLFFPFFFKKFTLLVIIFVRENKYKLKKKKKKIFSQLTEGPLSGKLSFLGNILYP